MLNYLKEDECVGGCFSFETRYTFCYTDVYMNFMVKTRIKKFI